MTDHRLPVLLLLLRLSIAAFFAVWALEKLVAPELAARVFDLFYGGAPSHGVLQLTGAAQLAVVVLFALGVARFWTYGALLLMHVAGTAASWQRLIDPFEAPNHLFWAAVPTLAALALLFVLRDEDRLGTLGDLRASDRR